MGVAIRRVPTRGALLLLLTILVATIGQLSAPVVVAAAVPNDDFADATRMRATVPLVETVDLADASIEAGEPMPSCWPSEDPITASIWYEFRPRDAGPFVVNDAQEGASLSIYTGRSLDALSEFRCRPRTEWRPLVFQADPGTTYLIRVGRILGTWPGSLSEVRIDRARPLNASIVYLPASPVTTADIVSFAPDDEVLTDPELQPITSYLWRFGDGETGTDQGVAHRYRVPGEYTVSLTVATEDGRTATGTTTVTVEAYDGPPLADFSWWPNPPTTADQVSFTDASNDPAEVGITDWSWDFGDGATASGPNVTHRFVVAGTYQVALTVSTGDGRQAIRTYPIGVGVPPSPIASIGLWPNDPSTYDTVSFYDGSWDPANVGIDTWDWSFGDGSSSTDRFPTHRYAADGSYQVALTVGTPDGRSATTSVTVTVKTHDVQITRIGAPRAASAGQTKPIIVDLVSLRYDESVQVCVSRGTSIGSELIPDGCRDVVQLIAGRPTRLSFDYLFTPDDATIGKVTFKVRVAIWDHRDAVPADNEAQTPPTRVNP